MTKRQLAKYKEVLLVKLEALSQAIRDHQGIAIEKAPDPLDEVQHASERELTISKLDRETQLLSNVRAALRRIEAGSYGECLHCGEEILTKRLNAVPWAPLCVTCQVLTEQEKTGHTQPAVASFAQAM